MLLQNCISEIRSDNVFSHSYQVRDFVILNTIVATGNVLDRHKEDLNLHTNLFVVARLHLATMINIW